MIAIGLGLAAAVLGSAEGRAEITIDASRPPSPPAALSFAA